jgi:cyclophilin family peptidyl-prolyl cis-trans isomerase
MMVMAKNFSKIVLLAILSGLLISCNQSSVNKPPEIKKGVAPIADAEVVVVEMEQPAYGKFTIELYSNIAPEMVKRFKELAREGFYDGTTIHRINQAVIQGGDPLSKDNDPKNDGTGKSAKPNVPAEFSDILYDSGIVGAARAMDVNSQNCQFFVTLKRTAEFDQKYTIFGKVTEGMNNVRTIAGTPRDGEKPIEAVKIKSVTVQPKK